MLTKKLAKHFLNKFAYLYSKPLGNHTLIVLGEPLNLNELCETV